MYNPRDSTPHWLETPNAYFEQERYITALRELKQVVDNADPHLSEFLKSGNRPKGEKDKETLTELQRNIIQHLHGNAKDMIKELPEYLKIGNDINKLFALLDKVCIPQTEQAKCLLVINTDYEFRSCKQVEGESVRFYFNKLRGMQQDLQTMGAHIHPAIFHKVFADGLLHQHVQAKQELLQTTNLAMEQTKLVDFVQQRIETHKAVWGRQQQQQFMFANKTQRKINRNCTYCKEHPTRNRFGEINTNLQYTHDTADCRIRSKAESQTTVQNTNKQE